MGSTFESEIEKYAYTCLTNEEPRKADQTFHSFFALFKLFLTLATLTKNIYHHSTTIRQLYFRLAYGFAC